MSLSVPVKQLGSSTQAGWLFRSLRYQLLLAYIQFVRPLIPVLSRSSLFNAIESPNIQQKAVSSLVLHAILYSGIPHVPVDVLVAHGFTSGDEAGKAFRLKFKVS